MMSIDFDNLSPTASGYLSEPILCALEPLDEPETPKDENWLEYANPLKAFTS